MRIVSSDISSWSFLFLSLKGWASTLLPSLLEGQSTAISFLVVKSCFGSFPSMNSFIHIYVCVYINILYSIYMMCVYIWYKCISCILHTYCIIMLDTAWSLDWLFSLLISPEECVKHFTLDHEGLSPYLSEASARILNQREGCQPYFVTNTFYHFWSSLVCQSLFQMLELIFILFL